MRKNTASQIVAFQMNSATDGSAVTSGTPTVYVTIDGGIQSTGLGTSTHEGNGQWSYAPTQAETNGNHVAYTMALSGAISQTVNIWPVSFDPTDATRMGLTALPNANAGAAGGLPTDSTGKTSFNDVSAADIVTNGAITTLSGAVVNVDTVDTCTTNTDMRGTDGANTTTPPTAAAIADAVCDEALSGHTTAGTVGKAISDIEADTNELQTDDIPTTLATLATSAALATVDSNVDAILLDTAEIGVAGAGLTEAGGTGDQFTAVPWNASWDAEVQSECTDALNAYDPPTNTEMEARTLTTAQRNALAQNVENTLGGTASGTPTTTTMVSNVSVTVDDQFKGRIIVFNDDTSTAALQNQATDITACTAATNTLTFTALTTAPSSGDTFRIL